MVRSTGDLIELCTAAPTDPMGTAALNFCHGFGVGVYRVLEEFESARKDSHVLHAGDDADAE